MIEQQSVISRRNFAGSFRELPRLVNQELRKQTPVDKPDYTTESFVIVGAAIGASVGVASAENAMPDRQLYRRIALSSFIGGAVGFIVDRSPIGTIVRESHKSANQP